MRSNALILDIDDKNQVLDLAFIKQQLMTDNRVALLYTSPSGMGLKIVCFFDKPVESINTYKDLYFTVADSFQKKYELGNCLDRSTHDVTRVSFLAADADVYYNTSAQKIVADQHEIIDSLPFWDISETLPEVIEVKKVNNNEQFENIKALLELKKQSDQKTSIPLIVPEILNTILPVLEQKMKTDLQIDILSVKDIQYGKQIHLQKDKLHFGLVNLYYGKKGFSAISNNKKNTSVALSNLVADLLLHYIAEIQY